MALFETPEQVRKRLLGQHRQRIGGMFQRMGTPTGGGLAGQLAALGRVAGAALTGQRPDIEGAPEVALAEKRQTVMQDIFGGLEPGKVPTSESVLGGFKSLLEQGDQAGAGQFLQMAGQLAAMEAAKTKATAKTGKPTYREVQTPEGPRMVEIRPGVTAEETVITPIGEVIPEKPPAPRETGISQKDVERVYSQATNVYKGMDFAAEVDIEDPDYKQFFELAAGETNRRLEAGRMKRTPANQIKVMRQVLKEAQKKGVVAKDENILGFKEPVLDTTKMESFFGITTPTDGMTDAQRKRLEELRKKYR